MMRKLAFLGKVPNLVPAFMQLVQGTNPSHQNRPPLSTTVRTNTIFFPNKDGM